MTIDLRNNNNSSKKNNINKDSNIQGNISDSRPILQKDNNSQIYKKSLFNNVPLEDNNLSIESDSKKNHNTKIKNNANTSLFLVLYNVIFLSIIVLVVAVDWSGVWQLPKSIGFIFGVLGLLLLTSIFWIFGLVKNKVNITLGDLIFIFLGISITIISLVNPNQISFWGSTVRLFDAGIFILFLVLFYIINKLFLEQKLLEIIYLFLASLILISGIFSSIYIYIPDLLKSLPILSRLQPTSSFITESPKELVFLTLLSINALSTYLHKIDKNKLFELVVKILFYVGILVHITLLIRLPGYVMYILTIITLITHSIAYISKINKNSETNKVNIKLISNRISFVYGVIIIFLLALMVIKPFQNNSNFPEYRVLTVPNINTSISIARKSLQSDTIFGSGNIMYAWNKFAPSANETQISDFSFETLNSEFFNLITKNGIIPTIILGLLGLWIIISFFRILFIKKVIPLEAYSLLLCIIALFLIPFTVVTKIIFVFIFILWNNVFSKYFSPLIKFDLDVNKVPASISSLFTFLILFMIAISVFFSTKAFNLIQSQENILKASKINDNPEQQDALLAQSKNLSPNYIEYTNFYINSRIQQISKTIRSISSTSQLSDSKNIDPDKQKEIQSNIVKVQELIDEYKKSFPSDNRVLYWQLELYSISDQYGDVKESDYLYSVARGKELQPNSLYWYLYEAQYYVREAQKDKELNIDKINKSKSILSSVLEKNIYFVDAYINYYDVLSLTKEYSEQINILNKYVNIMVDKDLIADQSLVYSLAQAYQNNKQYDEAISYYNKLLESFPNYTNVYFNLGEIYEAQKKKDLAIQKYQKVLELDSTAEIARKKIDQLK